MNSKIVSAPFNFHIFTYHNENIFKIKMLKKLKNAKKIKMRPKMLFKNINGTIVKPIDQPLK